MSIEKQTCSTQIGSPFQKHRQTFQKIPLEHRSQFRKKLLSLIQLPGQPKLYKQQYQCQDSWIFNKRYKLNYYYAKSVQTQKPKGVLFLFHGLNGHGGNSGYLGTNIAKNCPIDVYALDFKNFGLSEGPMRGYIAQFQEPLAQAEGFIDYIINNYYTHGFQNSKPKIIISGSSFGGTISFKLAINKPQKYSFLVLFSPGLRQVPQSLPFLKRIGKIIGCLCPTIKILKPSFSDGTKYCMQSKIIKDQRNYLGKVIPGTIRTVLNAIDQVSSQFSKLETSYILFQSGNDKFVDVFAPLDLEKQATKVKDKKTIYCKDMWHTVYSEEEMEYIVPIVIQWLNARIATNSIQKQQSLVQIQQTLAKMTKIEN